MKKRRLFAGIIDRLCLLFLYVLCVYAYFGIFTSSGYLGTYQALAFGTEPSTYDYMHYSQYSSPNDSVSPYFTQEYNKAAEIQGISSYQELDHTMTAVFVVVNILYFLCVGVFAKSSIGELLCGLSCFDPLGKKADVSLMVLRTIVFAILIIAFIWLRYFWDMTYLTTSILFLIINWVLICYNGKSLVDVCSFTHIDKG